MVGVTKDIKAEHKKNQNSLLQDKWNWNITSKRKWNIAKSQMKVVTAEEEPGIVL